MIISRTPFRISFFGGGSDFPEFYKEHGGATLSTTIDKCCYLSLHYLSPFFKFRYRASYAKTETVLKASEFQHPLIRECLMYLPTRQGLEISHVSDLPGRTGLGTSSSFTVGLLNALHELRHDKSITPQKLAEEAIMVERERVGDAGGHQDQYAAAFGGFLHILYQANEVKINRLNLPTNRLNELKNHLQLFFMGTERTSEIILQEQKKRTAINVPALKRMAEMVSQARKILGSTANIRDFGILLDEAWRLKKSLAGGISNPLVDEAYAAARAAGALGGKLLGGGGCGFIIFFVPPEKQKAVTKRLKNLQEVTFDFNNEGSRIIFKDQT
jgi:D-glycero-alpha-D-manno-heptose-7-phosphate kinase